MNVGAAQLPRAILSPGDWLERVLAGVELGNCMQ